MVYELYGIPGSGKSYYCKKIEKKSDIRNIYSFYKDTFIGKVYFHLFLILFKLNKCLRLKYQEILNLLGDIKYINRIDEKIEYTIFVKYLIFIYFLESKTKNNIIIDEGIFHYCSALYAEYGIEIEKIEKILKILEKDLKKEVYRVNCGVETALKQMKKRNRKQTAIDFLNEKELKVILKKYYEIGDFFQNSYNFLDIKILLKNMEIENDKV